MHNAGDVDAVTGAGLWRGALTVLGVADEAEARRVLAVHIATAARAANDSSSAQQSLVLAERRAWEHVGATAIPSLSAESIANALAVLPDPRLRTVFDGYAAQQASLAAEAADAADDVLDDSEAAALAERRKSIEQRLLQARQRQHALRLRPNFAADLERHKRGEPLAPDTLAPVREVLQLQASVDALDAEAARVLALLTRNLRGRRRLSAVEEQQRGIAEAFLRDARAVVVDALLQPGAPRPAAYAALLKVVDGVTAQREILEWCFAHWVRPHGMALAELDARRPADVHQLQTWLARVDDVVAAAVHGFGQWHEVLARVLRFDAYDRVVDNDWWTAIAPGLRAPKVPTQLTSETASDRLAAAWAQMSSSKSSPPLSSLSSSFDDSDGPGGEMTEAFSPPTSVVTAPAPVAFAPSQADDDPFAVFGGPSTSPAQKSSSKSSSSSSSSSVSSSSSSSSSSVSSVSSKSALAAPDPFLFPDEAFPLPSAGGPVPGFDDAPPKTENVFFEATREVVRRGASQAIRPTFAPNSRVGRCVIQSLIGKGGMGEVYRARLEGEGGFSRSVVLKRLALNFGDGDTTARKSELRAFVREAEIAARIAHPNVVQIFDVQMAGDEPYMIMEFLDGLSLHQLMKRVHSEGRAADLRVLIRCALDAARGLAAAHSMRGDDGNLVGLVHRDVSPDNLFLCSNGFTKLLDFGIARRNDAATQTLGELKGKVPYMSPEQILGETLDGRSDLFSLGSTLYWLLSGQRPFVGESDMTTLYAVVNKDHRPLKELVPQAPRALLELIEQLLRKPRDERPVGAAEVVVRLEACGPATPEEASTYLQALW